MGQMLQWEGRIVDNTNVQLLKAALPYLDQPVGNRIDLEGLLRSIRGFCRKNERQIIDLLLQIFMFRHVREMMTMMQEMKQEAEQSDSGTGNMEGMMEFLKSRIPPEQQDMVDMMSVFLSAMSEDNNGQSGRDVCEDEPGESEGFEAARSADKGNRDESGGTVCDAGDEGASQPESVIYSGGDGGDDGDSYS
ncbi:MAG: hypothetical protein J6B84_02855 [Eubacterium sp.]|nr:hypothetical protein [Eubacterium sp.]